MNKTINQIKDVELIEKELNQTASGVLAFYSKAETVVQDAVNFLYKDKNIFIFFDDDDEYYEKISLDSSVSFTTIRNGSLKHVENPQQSSLYYLFSVTINGIIKTVDDKKLVNFLLTNYSQKFTPASIKEPDDPQKPERILYIDSEEIQAFEEIGD